MSQELLTSFQVSALVISLLMILVWGISLVKKDVSIIDLAWGVGFVVVAWAVAYKTPTPHTNWAILIPITAWGLRLSTYLAWRNHGQPEDFRYRKMRERWGKRFPVVSLLTVFVLQGIVMWVVSLPIQAGVTLANPHFSWWLLPGLLLWFVGFSFEALADWQLLRFKAVAENQGQVLNTGLWKYTRHPNYFGDFLLWWGIYIIAISQTDAYWTIISPLVMSLCLMKISGVTLLEKTLSTSKPEYIEYQRTTNAFFPGKPKQET